MTEWYVSCVTCHRTAQYSHPPCNCREEKRQALFAKILGAALVAVTEWQEENFQAAIMVFQKRDQQKIYVQMATGKLGAREGPHDVLTEISPEAGEKLIAQTNSKVQ